jgi:phosphate/sulfate permease
MWMSPGHDYACTNCRKPSRLRVSLKKSVVLQGIGGGASGTTFHLLVWRFRMEIAVAFMLFAIAAFFISFIMAWASARLAPLKEDETPKAD